MNGRFQSVISTTRLCIRAITKYHQSSARNSYISNFMKFIGVQRVWNPGILGNVLLKHPLKFFSGSLLVSSGSIAYCYAFDTSKIANVRQNDMSSKKYNRIMYYKYPHISEPLIWKDVMWCELLNVEGISIFSEELVEINWDSRIRG